MSLFDWHYRRNNCVTCAKADDFIARHKLKAQTVVDARKNTIDGKGALELATKVDNIYVSKGSKLVHLDMKKDKPDKDTLKSLIIGPTGNLRAPTIRQGKTLLIGFNQEAYKKVLV